MNKWMYLILGLALILRAFSLSSFPTGFTPDEASFGYDAYSILKTGKDQWGHPFPLVLESFGDFKSPLYAYIAIPFVGIFGLNKFSVRLPNALLGTAAVYVTYLLVNELLSYLVVKNKKANPPITNLPTKVSSQTDQPSLAIISAFLLAISPWHIMMSRGAFEANLTTFFLPFGMYLFLKGLKVNKLFIWSVLIFGLNLFTYHSAKLVTPLVLFFLVFVYRKELLALGFQKLVFPTTIILIFFAILVYTFYLGAGARVADLTIFRGSLEAASEQRFVASLEGMPDVLARALHNKYQIFFRRFVSNYFQYLSPQFLFTNGPSETTYGMVRERGVLYWLELPFFLGFIIFLSKRSLNSLKILAPIVFWILVAPIPAALASGPGYAANRAVIMLPAIQVVLSFGAWQIYEEIKSFIPKPFLKYTSAGFLVLSSIFFLSFLEDYFIQSPRKIAKGMLYGNYESMLWLKDNLSGPQDVVVSRRLSEPHIYVAFVNKLNPRAYQKAVKDWDYKQRGLGWVDQMPKYGLGNYIFKNIDFNLDKEGGVLLVGKPEEFPEKTERLQTFSYPNGEEAVLIVDPTVQHYAYETK